MPWFKEWFNSRYYHLLYGKRDENEAEAFINHLMDVLQPDETSKFLDLACGKGRHSLQIANLGYNVTGVDLSEESIKAAQKFSNPLLSFDVHDMRLPYKQQYFDYVLNLFTSFGYFDSENDNLETLRSVHQDLKPNGIFVQDYFNAHKVVAKMVPYEVKTIEGIEFEIKKHIENTCIFKSIKFADQGVDYQFCEKVNLFFLSDFEKLYAQAGFEIIHVYGNYKLSNFDAETSDRLILVSKAI